MDATKIDVFELKSYKLGKIVDWYNQVDKSWIYCDCPLDYDYSHVRNNIETQLNTTFKNLDDITRVKYYCITCCGRMIGFAIIRKKSDYFDDMQGYSIGIDIPEKTARGEGCGTIVIRKLLHKLAGIRDIRSNQIYLETLSYNIPMQKVAEKNGFELVEQKEMGKEYQIGLSKHIDEIADCLNIGTEKLQKEKVEALLYRIKLDNWPNIELKKIAESDTGLFDSIELYDDDKRYYADPSFFDYTITEQNIPFAFYDNHTLVGGVSIMYDDTNFTCEIRDFFIDEKYHGCGYGKKSFNTIIEYIKSNQNHKTEKVLLDVDTRNVVALNIYWNAGFRPIKYDTVGKNWRMELALA